MGDKADVWQGTLALMVLKTLETLGPLHGYGIARRIEQTSGDLLSLNYGTLYPALLKLEQEGAIASEWGRLGEQPQGQVLPADAVGPETARTGDATTGNRRPRSSRGSCRRRRGRGMRTLRAWLARLGRLLPSATAAIARSPRSSKATCRCTSTTTSAPA